MLPIPQIELNVTRAYIRHIQEKFPAGDHIAGRYLFILQIREWQQRRKMLGKPATLENLQTLKTGHREAERFYLDIDKGSPRHTVVEIQSLLQLIALEFHAEIVEIEALHPQLRAEFAREREEYRQMWNHYVTEVQRQNA